MDLSEVAADVAAALWLTVETRLDRAKYVGGLSDGDGKNGLNADGSNLTDPYWRCRCEDWLLERGALTLACENGNLAPNRHGWLPKSGSVQDDVWIDFCAPTEAPACGRNQQQHIDQSARRHRRLRASAGHD